MVDPEGLMVGQMPGQLLGLENQIPDQGGQTAAQEDQMEDPGCQMAD
jgi:hypothetical protein